LDNAVFVTTKAIVNNLLAELTSGTKGDVSAFFEFTRHKGSEVFVSPKIFRLLAKNLLEIDEEAFSQINSLIEDGGYIIIGDADFGSEYDDVVIIANKLFLTRTNSKIFMIKSKNEDIGHSAERYSDVAILDLESIIEIIKASDKEFRRLYWG